MYPQGEQQGGSARRCPRRRGLPPFDVSGQTMPVPAFHPTDTI